MIRRTFIAAAIAAAAAAPAAAQTSDITGNWKVNFNTGQGPIAATLTLAKTGEKITGKIASERGETTVEASQTDKAVRVWFQYNDPGGGPMSIEMNGTLDGDAMKGAFTAGGSPTGEWEAHRDTAAKTPAPAATTTAPAEGVSGTWNITVQLPEMTATPTLTLKQDGEKLTGDYVSAQYGKFPITGTFKDGTVSFSFTMTIEGNAVEVTYAGKADKDAMKGNVNYGGMMSGSFTAARKK